MNREYIHEPTMREIRYRDKLVDESAKGKAMERFCGPDQPHTTKGAPEADGKVVIELAEQAPCKNAKAT